MKKAIKLTLILSVTALVLGGFAYVSQINTSVQIAGSTDPGGGRPGG